MLKKSQLYNYQKKVIRHIIRNPFAGLFLDMGLGKTICVLTAAEHLIYKELAVGSVLIVGPKRVVSSTWPDEVQKWEHLQHLKISPIIGRTEKHRLAAMRVKADIYLISRDNLSWLISQFGGSMLPYDWLVIDESSSFKDPKSKRSIALKAVQACFDRVTIMTGTPAPNSLIDLWFPIWLLDRGARLGKFITHFRQNFFDRICPPGSMFGKYIASEKDQLRIFKRIKDIVITLRKEDYLDLKPVNYIDVPVYLSDPVKAKYKKFERDKVMEIIESEDLLPKRLTVATAAALSGKLLQFAGGAVYDEDKNVHHIHSEKLEALEELVESANGSPVLIAYSFQHELDRIMKTLKAYKPVHFKSDQHIKDWNAGKIQVLVMHPASGSHGLNLQYGGHIQIWYGLVWPLELYLQWNERLARPGQTEQVRIYRIIVKGTEDESVIKSWNSKGAVQDSLLNATKAKIEKYKNSFD